MDRCHNGTAAARRMDPSLSTPCSWVLPYKRRPLDKLGRGHEGKLQILIKYIVSANRDIHFLVKKLAKFAFPCFHKLICIALDSVEKSTSEAYFMFK